MYCTDCGKELTKEPTGKFSYETGEPSFREVCTYDCQHGRHRFEFKSELFGFSGSFVCTKCGHRL